MRALVIKGIGKKEGRLRAGGRRGEEVRENKTEKREGTSRILDEDRRKNNCLYRFRRFRERVDYASMFDGSSNNPSKKPKKKRNAINQINSDNRSEEFH